MNISKAGHNFRELMAAWDGFVTVFREEDEHRVKEGRVKALVYGQNFIFFFRYKGDIYGGSEEARLTFATMRAGEEEVEEMMFGASNLTSALKGRPAVEFFKAEDAADIRVLDKKTAEQLLTRGSSKAPSQEKTTDLSKTEKDTDYGLPYLNRDVE
jgi:hypothetical protein